MPCPAATMPASTASNGNRAAAVAAAAAKDSKVPDDPGTGPFLDRDACETPAISPPAREAEGRLTGS